MFIENLPAKLPPIGERNILTARRILDELGFSVLSENVGLCVHRTLLFEAGTGDVWMKQGPSKCRMECVFKPEMGCSHAR